MKLRPPNHATVVAYLALFTALAGGAYAVSKVGTKDLRPNAVTSAKIKDGSVGAHDLKSLTIRSVREPAEPSGDGELVAACKKRERLLGGTGGWILTPGGSAPVISSSLLTGRSLSLRGFTPVLPNTLKVQVVCLRR